MKTHLLAAALFFSGAAMISGVASAKPPAQCRDANGKFIACPKTPPVVVKCKDASGKFAKCGTPGATPVAATTSTSTTSTTTTTTKPPTPPTPTPKPN